MGDWRRAQVIGAIRDGDDIDKLKRAIDMRQMHIEPTVPFGPLTISGGMCGLPLWPAREFDVVGNLGERGYDQEDVKGHLKQLGDVAESFTCKVHVGDHHESDDCVATVILDDEGCRIVEPEIERIPQLDEAQMQRNMLRQLMGG